MQVADGGLAVIYVDRAPRSTSDWLCREETVQVDGSIIIKPSRSVTSETPRLGCGAHSALLFNITGVGRNSPASLTLERLTVEGVILTVRKGHVAVVEARLLDVSFVSDGMNTYDVGLDVINSTWTSRYPNNLTTCEVSVRGH